MPHPPSLHLLRTLRYCIEPSRARHTDRCTLRYAISAYTRRERPRSSLARYVSTTYHSSTAVTATKQIPLQFRNLYDGLVALQRDAPSHVNLGKLKLALRGLESPTPTVRVALLALNDLASVRQLTRLLLADPLKPSAAWETKLGDLEKYEGKSLLLRYGSELDSVSSSPILAIQSVPSSFLQKNKIELLLTTISVPGPISGSANELKDTVLMPLISTPASSTGSVSMIRHPVHCSLVVATGLDGCLDLGLTSLTTEPNPRSGNVVTAVLNIASTNKELQWDKTPSNLITIDVQKANRALESLRESSENGADFAQGWEESNLSAVAEWVSTASKASHGGLPKAISDLIQDSITDTAENISSARYVAQKRLNSVKNGEQLEPLQQAVHEWSTKSHEELRDQLAQATSDKDWVKLKWWKLFWRADDVGMVLTQVLEHSWLAQAEKQLMWIEGRCEEARLGRAPERPAERTDENLIAKPEAKPIAIARERIFENTVPSLESLAQHFVVQTLSLTVISSAFAGLVLASWPAITVFQAGAFAALGLTLSLKRLQSGWESAKESWVNELRDHGRKTLHSTEDSIKARLAAGPYASEEDEQSLEDLVIAQAAVDGARQAFDELGAK